jgi:hypothetical protein
LFRAEVIRVGEEAFQAAAAETDDSLALPAFRRHGRMRRSTLAHRFCLLLWARRSAVSDERGTGHRLDDETASIADVLGEQPQTFRSRIASLTFALDQAGCFALMLWPEDLADPPPDPLVLPSPPISVDRDNPASMKMWEYVFTGFVELAHAIIVEGRHAIVVDDEERDSGLKVELDHIREMGLLDRVLRFDDNAEVHRLNHHDRWPLERLADAVACAAAAAATVG